MPINFNTLYNNTEEVNRFYRDLGMTEGKPEIDSGAFGNLTSPFKSIAYGMGRGSAVLMDMVALAGSNIPTVMDVLDGDGEPDKADWYFKNIKDATKERVDAMVYEPLEIGYMDRVAGGLAQVFTQMSYGGITPAVAGTFHEEASGAIDRGLSLSQAYGLGGVNAAAFGIGAGSPALARQALKTMAKKTVVDGAVKKTVKDLSIGQAIGVGAVSNPLLNYGAFKLSTEIVPEEPRDYNGIQFITDLLLGGAFGIFDGSIKPKADLTAEQNTLVNNLSEQTVVNGLNPVLRGTAEDAGIDLVNQNSALDSVLGGDVVDVPNPVDDATIESSLDEKINNSSEEIISTIEDAKNDPNSSFFNDQQIDVNAVKANLAEIKDNLDLRTAIVKKDMPAVLEILSKSPNPIIREIVNMMKGFHTIAFPSIRISRQSDRLKRSVAAGYTPSAFDNEMNNLGLSGGVFVKDSMYKTSNRYKTIYPARDENIVAHELVHSMTYYNLKNPSPAKAHVVKKLNDLYEYTLKLSRGMKEGRMYGFKNVDEFVSEGLTNPEFQAYLNTIKYKSDTLWTKFTKTIADLIGMKYNSAFTEFLSLSDELIRGEVGDIRYLDERFLDESTAKVIEPEKISNEQDIIDADIAEALTDSNPTKLLDQYGDMELDIDGEMMTLTDMIAKEDDFIKAEMSNIVDGVTAFAKCVFGSGG